MMQHLLGSFLRRKGGGGGIPVSGPAARTTRPEPPCSMPPVCGSRLDRQPDSRLQPTRPQLYGPTAQDPPVTHHTPGFWPGRSRICLDAGSQPIAGPPSPEHPHSSGGVPQLHPTAKAWNRPEHPRHGPARPMRAAKYLASVPHSEAPQPAPPKPCHPAIQALRPGPQSQPAPTCSNSSNLNSHPTSIYYAFNL